MFTTLKQCVSRLRSLFGSRDDDRDFEQELASHLEMLADDNLRQGMKPDEAQRAARVRMGALASIQEQHRSVRGFPAVDALVKDLRFAFRLIGRERKFAAAVILALALGIGVNAAGFTIVNAAFLRGLPFDDGRLYMLSWQTRSGDRSTVSHTELQDWRVRSRAFAGIAGFNGEPVNISDDRTWPAEVRGAQITANAFGLLREQPFLGRDFAPGDERKSAQPVAIIGYDLWKSRYGADRHVLGTTIRVNGQPASIIGVMPDGMKFPENAEVWVPFIPTAAQEQRSARVLTVFGRLHEHANSASAEGELRGVAAQLAAAFPDTNKDLVGVRVQTFSKYFVGGPARIMFMATIGAVTLVLMIACANVANLLLSRSAQRAREMTVRMALGATRWRVIRQLLIESTVLAFIGGGIGLMFALAGVQLFDAAVQDPGKPYWIVFKADYVVFGYVAAVCILTALVAGLAPALHVSKSSRHEMLKEGARGSTAGVRAQWFSSTMVVVELALTIVLLAGAGLMVRSFMKLYTADLGFSTDSLVTLRLQLPVSAYASAEARRAFFGTLEGRLAAVPGIEGVALTNGVPPRDGVERLLEIDDPKQVEGRPTFVSTVTISPPFFDVLRVPLLRGRRFQDTDGAPGAETVIVSERLASQYFRGDDPIGRRIRFVERQPKPGEPAPVWRTIVGVTGSIRQGSPRDARLNPVVYVPYRQDSRGTASLLVRSRLQTASIAEIVRREVRAIDKDQPVFAVQTLDDFVKETRWAYRVFGSSFAIFAAIALVLSSMGLYAVMAYSVTQRTREIGMRMALGAQPRQVSWDVLKRGLLQLAVGLTVGLAGAWALSRLIEGVLVEITPGDPLTFTGITLLLILVAIAACLLPARQATRVDPLVALRAE